MSRALLSPPTHQGIHVTRQAKLDRHECPKKIAPGSGENREFKSSQNVGYNCIDGETLSYVVEILTVKIYFDRELGQRTLFSAYSGYSV